MATIIDYGAGNLKSVQNALQFLGEESEIAKSKETIEKAERLIVPGVGNFGPAMAFLRKRGMDKALKEAVAEGVPFLGICLGMQILFERSEESKGARGLGILKGEVLKIKTEYKLPQIGWNSIEIKREGRLLKGVKNGSRMYFVNSFVAANNDEGIVSAISEYGQSFPSVIEKGNIFATQFHPEKSSGQGLRLIRNFLEVKL